MMRCRFALLLFLAGCASVQPTEAQLLALKSRFFPGAQKPDVFNHFKHALLLNRYSIKSAELVDGTIVASRKLPEIDGATERREDIIVNLDQTPKGVRSQISIQMLTHYSLGGTYGKELTEKTAYDRIYTRLLKNRDTNRIPASLRIR